MRHSTASSLGRRFTALAVVACAALSVGAASASADFGRPVIPGEQTLVGAHTTVHYGETTSTATAVNARSALETSWLIFRDQLAFPEPPSDAASDPTGDGHLDLYIVPNSLLPAGSENRGYAQQESVLGQEPAPSFLVLHESMPQALISHELFHSFQYAVDRSELRAPSAWWAEMTANWAAQVVYPGMIPDTATLTGSPICDAAPGAPRSCYDSTYNWWPFVAHLAAKFGQRFPQEVWARQAELGLGSTESHARQALEERLAARGSSLNTELEQFLAARRVSPPPSNPLSLHSSLFVRKGSRVFDRSSQRLPSRATRTVTLFPRRGVKRINVVLVGGDQRFDRFEVIKRSSAVVVRTLSSMRQRGGLTATARLGNRQALRVVSTVPAGGVRLVRLAKVIGS